MYLKISVNYQTANIVAAPYAKVSTLKTKPETSPPSTPACERTSKKQKIKTAPGAKDLTKAGLFHCKDGTPHLDLFPSNLEKKCCTFFCLHGKKCSKLAQVCEYEHIGKWEKIPANDQIKILKHCRFGLMPRPLRSIRLLFLTSTRTS